MSSSFAPDKFDLVHFVPGRYRTRFDINKPLHLPGHTVIPKQGVRYLGVYLDSALNWNKHIERVQADATQLLSGLTSLAGSTWGTRLTSLIKIYRGTILAKALFCCPVWYIPNRGEGYARAEQAMIRKLEAIQKEAARIISGGFRRAAGSALNVELNLLPIKQELEKRIGMTLGRMVASPVYNTICEIRKGIRAISSYRLRPQLHSPLLHIERRYQAERRIQCPVAELERKVPFVAEPWWVPPAIHIAPDRPQSITEHNELVQDPRVLPVYTDGSGYKKRVGSAATIPLIPGALKKAFLGCLVSKHSVYAAELYGILMALQLVLEQLPSRKEVIIFTDNHAAIKSTHRPRYQNGQYIICQIIRILPEVLAKGYSVQIRWISAHSGVTGNECVDAHAKDAAVHGQQPHELPTLISALKAWVRRRVAIDWSRDWHKDNTGRTTYRLTKLVNKPEILYKHLGEHKAISALITQMRTGKIGLRSFLYPLGLAPTSQCDCGRGVQDLLHVLVTCPSHRELRNELFGPSMETDLVRILNGNWLVRKAAIFMAKTGLLRQFSGLDLAVLEEH